MPISSDVVLDDKKAKSLLACQTKLKYTYLAWVLFRLCAMPWIYSAYAKESSHGVSLAWQMLIAWQILILLPALLFLPTVRRSNHPYRLIILSFVAMVYAGVAASHWLIAWYEGKPNLLVWAYGVESGLLLLVLGLLFMTLKKLPPMHKMSGNQNR